ncbi:hypothetical protein P171DRAFT_184198 [Karstenula rhodostoma CBS 690.94]|uniref:Uncharacterized protein n=1 Tax=Karstenula rhodostoma CBS 690.94 TaxID=1392251 RepID=A0A9P4U5R7_9PLEO|nr:hypothetical protein P171DRAFT_184198 [Karstenula rhodostoma CBS 690.94]
MAGLGLEVNKITFHTYRSDSTWLSAALFSTALENVTARQSILINELAPRLLTVDIARAITDEFPQFESLLQLWQTGDEIAFPTLGGSARFPTNLRWGELRTIWVDFVRCTLRNLAKHPDFIDEAEHTVQSWKPTLPGERSATPWDPDVNNWRYDAASLAAAHPLLWDIPNLEASTNLALLAEPDPLGKRKWKARSNVDLYAHSAASIAIRFLESVSSAVQARVRQIILLEDRVTVANSPSHVQGLLPFYRANPRLHIQRVVNVWEVGITPETRFAIEPLRISAITKSLGCWILETMRLQGQIPEGSFQLILDGNPTLDITSEAFRLMMHGAALHNALNELFDRQVLPRPSLLHSSRNRAFAYHYNGLYEALRKLGDGQCASWIDCNFEIGTMPDTQSLIEERSGWSVEDWEHEWNEHLLQEFETGDPLPPYRELHPVSIAYW